MRILHQVWSRVPADTAHVDGHAHLLGFLLPGGNQLLGPQRADLTTMALCKTPLCPVLTACTNELTRGFKKLEKTDIPSIIHFLFPRTYPPPDHSWSERQAWACPVLQLCHPVAREQPPPGPRGDEQPRAAAGVAPAGQRAAELRGHPHSKPSAPSPGGQERLCWGSVTLVAFYESTARPRRASRLHTPSRDRKSKDPSWEASRT